MKHKYLFVLLFSLFSLFFFNCSKVAFKEAQQGSNVESSEDAFSTPLPPSNPVILLSENKLVFGNLLVNDVATLTVKVTNKTLGNIVVENIAVSDSMKAIYEISSPDCRGKINMGDQISKNSSCAFEIKFRPSRIDSFNETLSFKFKDYDLQTVNLFGAGIPTPVVGACRVYPSGTSVQPTAVNRCLAGLQENFRVNTVAGRYEWACRGTSNIAPCVAVYNALERCDGDNSREQNVVKVLIDGTTIPHRSCSRNNLANGGKNCLDHGGVGICCSDSGQVAINTNCVTPAGPGAYCFATSGCQAGLSCNGNVCN